MITSFKIYEKSGEYPRIGYYVIYNCGIIYKINNILIEDKHRYFFNNNVAKIFDINRNDENITVYRVFYENAPKFIREIQEGLGLWLTREDILDFSKDKEYLKIKIDTEKFGL